MGRMDLEMIESEKDSNLSEPFPKNLNPCRRILFCLSIGLAIIIFGVLLAALGFQNYLLWENSKSLDELSPPEKKIHDVIWRGGALIFKSDAEESREPAKFEYNKDASLNPKCELVPPNFQTGSKILTLGGKCVRTYSHENCVGLSIARYPKTSAPRETAEDAGEIKSMSMCFINELDDHTEKYPGKSVNSVFQKRTVDFKSNEPEIPDQIVIDSKMAMNLDLDSLKPLTNLSSTGNYTSSDGKIIEFDVKKSDLDENGNLPEKIIIPEKYKLPISTSWNRRVLFKVGKSIAKFLSSNPKGTLVRVKVQLENSSRRTTSGTASGFLYRIQFGQREIQTFYVASDTKYQ